MRTQPRAAAPPRPTGRRRQPHTQNLKRGPGRPPHATGRVKDREDAGPVAEHVLYACCWVVTTHEEGRGFHPTVVRRLWKARSTCVLVFGHTQGRSIYAGPPGPCGSRASQSRNTESARPLMDPSSACGAGGCAHTGLQPRPPETDSRPPVTKPEQITYRFPGLSEHSWAGQQLSPSPHLEC